MTQLPTVSKSDQQALLDAAAKNQQTYVRATSIFSDVGDALADYYHEQLDFALNELAAALEITIPDTCDIPDLTGMTVDEFVETIYQNCIKESATPV